MAAFKAPDAREIGQSTFSVSAMTTLDLPSLIAPQPNLKSLRVSNERYERDADFIFNLAVKKDRRLETGRILAARRKKLAPITITSSKSTTTSLRSSTQ